MAGTNGSERNGKAATTEAQTLARLWCRRTTRRSKGRPVEDETDLVAAFAGLLAMGHTFADLKARIDAERDYYEYFSAWHKRLPKPGKRRLEMRVLLRQWEQQRENLKGQIRNLQDDLDNGILKANRGHPRRVEASEVERRNILAQIAGLQERLTVLDAARPVETTPAAQRNGHQDNGEDQSTFRIPIVTPASQIRPEPVPWLWNLWLCLSGLNVLDGEVEMGKSTLIADVSARISRGWPMPPEPTGCMVRDPRSVILIPGEDDPNYTLVPRLTAAGADLERVHVFTEVKVGDELEPAELPFDLERLADYVRTHQASLVVVDPFTAFLSGEVDATSPHAMSRCMHRMKRWAKLVEVAMLLLRNFNKNSGQSSLDRGFLSKAVIGNARCSWIVGRDPENLDQRVLAMNKSNPGVRPPSLLYKVVASDSKHGAGRIAWGEESVLMPWDLILSMPQRGKTVDRDEAKEFLREMLVSGKPVKVAAIEKAAEENGLAWRTVQRARIDLGVVSENTGRGWSWRLPAPKPPA
jgi:hypothetical protein